MNNDTCVIVILDRFRARFMKFDGKWDLVDCSGCLVGTTFATIKLYAEFQGMVAAKAEELGVE